MGDSGYWLSLRCFAVTSKDLPALLVALAFHPVSLKAVSSGCILIYACSFCPCASFPPSLLGMDYPATASRKSSWGTPSCQSSCSILLRSTRVVCIAPGPGLMGILTVCQRPRIMVTVNSRVPLCCTHPLHPDPVLSARATGPQRASSVRQVS